MSENAARTQRSVPGMIGAMLVLLVIIGVFVAVRSFTRDNVEVPPTPVDYLAAVTGAQAAGGAVLYPSELPAGWVATSVVLPRTAEQPWGLGMLTDDERFVALRQETLSEQALVRAELGDEARLDAPIDVPGSLVTGWRSVRSADEIGLVAQRHGRAVLVYGTATPADLELLAAVLTDKPLSVP